MSDKAWQLFFGELREEGLALVDEADAERLSVRCFKLAETFLRTRHRRFSQPSIIISGPSEDRRPEARPVPPPRPEPVIPIEKRLPDDPSTLSKEQAEALIEEAQEVAESRSSQPAPTDNEPAVTAAPAEPATTAETLPAPEAEGSSTEIAETPSSETPSSETAGPRLVSEPASSPKSEATTAAPSTAAAESPAPEAQKAPAEEP